MNVIFDLDGTLALIDHRKHFIEGPKKDWNGFFMACVDDKPNDKIISVNKALSKMGYHIEIWSGRSDLVWVETYEWLRKYNIQYSNIRMRKEGDYTPDHKIKEMWLNEFMGRNSSLWPERENMLVFDDRDKVVKMWRNNGITCCQVAPGDF